LNPATGSPVSSRARSQRKVMGAESVAIVDLG
jgi:hypothetical protein